MRLSAFQAGFLGLMAAGSFGGSAALADVQFESSKAEKGPAAITASVRYDDVSVTEASAGFKTIYLPGLTPLAQAGKPDLSATGQLIAIPEGYRAVLTVGKVVEKELPKTVIEPYRKKYRCSGKQDLQATDMALYTSSSVFPASPVTIEEVGDMQGVRLARLAVYPVRQDFKNRSVRIIQSMDARVDFVPIQGAQRAKAELSPIMHNLVSKVAINGNDAIKRASQDSAETMILITADHLMRSMQPLIEWKAQRGINVLAFTYRELGGSPETVKEKIQEIYDTAEVKPSYILLAGNGSSLPPFFRSTGSGQAASDYPYTLLSGDDIIPDVLIGRIVADNAAEAAIYVRKTIANETITHTDSEWYSMGTTIASNEGSNPSDEQYAEMIQGHLKDHTYSDVDAFYQGDYNATPSNINEALDEGRTWLTYIGHGSGTSWGSTNGSYGLNYISRVQNSNKLPVLVDVACDNGSFVRINKCFGKAWMTHEVDGELGGLSAYYGGSVSISWHPPAVMSVGAAKYHFEKGTHAIGATALAGQMYLIEEMGTGSGIVDNLEWYNLFGDPSMIMRTAAPANVAIKHNFSAGGLTVEALDEEGNGIMDLLVSVTSKNGTKPVQVGRTDHNGSARLTLNGQSNLEGYVLTISGYNYETRQMDF